MLVKGCIDMCYTRIDKAMMKRRGTLEMRFDRGNTHESPPPPTAGMTIREWFAGLALANPELMKDVPESERAVEAVRLADELAAALAAPLVPTMKSMRPPSKKEMRAWEKKIKVDKAAIIGRVGDTNVASPNARDRRRDVIFPAAPDDFNCDRNSLPPLPLPLRASSRAHLPEDTTYSSIDQDPDRRAKKWPIEG